MSGDQTKRGGLGPYGLVYGLFSSIRRSPAASFVILLAFLLFVYGVLRITVEPHAERRFAQEALQNRMYILGVSSIVMSGFLFVGGCILATRRKD